MMNMLSVGRSPQNDRKSMDIRYDISVKPNERISANSTVDSLQILINEFGKGIDKRKHGSTITRFDINKKAIILLADLDNHLSNILESRGGSGGSSSNSKVRGDKSTFDFVKVEGVLFKALQCQYVTPCDVLSMRRILCSCLHKLFSIDTQMIAKCATKYVTTLDTLSSSTSSYTTLVGLLYSLCVLCQVACQLMPPLNNMIPLLVKLWKLYSDSIKVAVLELTSAYAANLPRGIVNDWPELIKMAQRGVAERSNEVKKAAGDLSLTIASRVTPDLTQNRNFDTFLSFITKSMDDNYMGVRAAFGCAAGELLCRAISLENNDHDVDVDGGDGQQDLKRKPSSSSSSMKHLYTCGYSLILLTSQFSKVGASKDLREAITISVIHFLSKCPESVIEMNIEIIVSNIIGLLGNVKAYITSGDLLQAQMYVSQMIRMGIVHRLDEAGRLAAIKEFTKIISRYTSNQYAMLCLLREIAALCNALGEVVENVRDVVLEAIMISLAHGSDYVRYAGSLTTRSLAASIPTHSISFVSALVNMVQIDHAELVDTPNTKPQEQERIANSLHGHSNALATLIYTSTKRSLTVSHILCSAVLDTALLLGKITPNMSPYVAMRRQEACWVLVCSVLSLSDHWIKLNLDRITELWEKSLGGKSTSKLPTEDSQISSILRAKAAALLSLTIFITTCETLLNEEMLNRIYGYFANTIKLLSTLPQNYKPASSASLYSINILKLYLFELIRRLPTSLLAKPQQKNVVNFVTKLAFAEIDGTHNGVETSLLHTSILAPAIENEMHAVDLFDVLMEDQMRFFSKSGQLYLFSQEHPQFQEITVEADSSCILDDSKLSFFEKPLSLNVRLVDSAIRLLGVLFQYHKATSKSQIIEYFISHIKTTYTLPDDVRLSNTVFSNVIASIYCILLRMKANNNNNSRSNSSADDTDKNFYSSVHSILTAALGHISQSIRRAASKTLAVLASMIGAAVMEDLLKKCAAKFAKEGPVKSGYSLALGDVNKALGSLSSRNHLPQTVSFLIALARSNSPNTQLCAFQSIWNTIETSGIGFGAHVDSILQQLVFLFFSPIGTPTEQHMNKDDDKHILLGSTRILYAFTALGPDVIERASFKDIFHLLIHDILSSDLTPVQIEATRLIERAILLAPMLIPNLRDIVIGLKRFLQNPSSHSALKRMTANCIKIIAEKEIDLICEIFNPKLLFQLLDQCQEIDEEENGSQFIKQIISLQIQAKSSQCSPKIWIPLIHEIVSSEPRRSRVNDQSVGGLVADTDDMEKNIPSITATVTTTTTTEESFNYSWQVKVFAVNCLLELLDVYKVDDNHVDLKKARDLPNGDYLVQHLTQLIDICSIALNKGTISIKHAGLLGLISILKIFENVPDPDVPDEPLLLQHTAKFGAAISLGFEAKSPPLLCYVACELASIYIPSKLLIGQPNSMARICSYMTDQLPKLGDLNTSQYGEVASTMIKVIILSTLATIYNAADESGNKELFSVLEKDVPLMFTNWQKCLKDYGLISTILSDAASEYANYDHNNSGHHHHSTSTAFLEEGTEKSVETYFSSAYPHIINAVTRMSARKYQEYYAMREKNKTRNKNSGEEEEEEVVPLFEYNYDVALVLGIAVRGLYENKKINESTLPTILSCIRSITRLIQSPQYLTLPFAPGATFELFLLLIKMQASREMTLQYACLKLLNTIVTETDMTLFGSSDQISTQAIVTTSTEVCLKPLRMQFPSLFEQDSEQQLMSTNLRMSNNHDELTRERMRLVKQCMSCLKTIVQRFKESVNGASVTTILYSLCRILQFTQSSSCLEVALALSELEVQSSSISTLDETSVWMVAFEAAIENLRLRIRDVKITTPLEVELLFICIASVHKCVVQQQQQQQQQLEMKNERQILQFAAINESVIQTLRGILSDPQAVSNAFFVRRVSWVLQGIQNGLLRLAKSTQHSDLALFYMSELSGPVCAYLMKVFNSGRITNEQYENYSEQQQLNEGELIVAVIPAGLNILLTGYSLISDSGKKCSYLRVMIPLLVAMLRMIKTSSTISSEWKHQENLNKIHKLAVQCLERLAQSAAIEFTQVVKSLPPTVVLEIQQEVKKGKERDSHHHHHNHRSAQQQQQQQQKPKQKLEINFDAYVVAKKSQQAQQQQQQDQEQPSQQ